VELVILDRVAIEIKRRIDVAVWAYAYEIKAAPLVDDATFDIEAAKVDASIRTGNTKLDDFFANEFVAFSGAWVHKHPDLKGLERVYQLKANVRRRWGGGQ
jgi:hypothetical protein